MEIFGTDLPMKLIIGGINLSDNIKMGNLLNKGKLFMSNHKLDKVNKTSFKLFVCVAVFLFLITCKSEEKKKEDLALKIA